MITQPMAREFPVHQDPVYRTDRALFVLNREGVIHWSYVSPVDVNPGVDGVPRALETLPPLSDRDHQLGRRMHLLPWQSMEIMSAPTAALGLALVHGLVTGARPISRLLPKQPPVEGARGMTPPAETL